MMVKVGLVVVFSFIVFVNSQPFTINPDSQSCADFTLDVNTEHADNTIFTLTSNCGNINEKYQNVSTTDNFMSYGLIPSILLNIISLGSNNHPDIIIDIISNNSSGLELIIDINNALIPNREINIVFMPINSYSIIELTQHIATIDDDVHQIETQLNQLQTNIYSVTGDVTLTNGMVNYGGGFAGGKWEIKNGFCYVTGLIKSTTNLSAWTTFGILPEQCRPKTGRLIFSLMQYGVFGRIDVLTDGSIIMGANIQTNQWISLTGISFPV